MFLDKRHVMESLREIATPGTDTPQQGNQCLLKLMSLPKLLHSLTVTGVGSCCHISCVTSDLVWVSDNICNLILTDTTGVPLHRVKGSCSDGGFHTVNSENELIYIDRNYNINKLSKDMKTTTTFIERTDSTWRPRCVYWSPSTGDLLIGMCYRHTDTGKVTRYNQSGQQTQTIQHDNTGRGLYRKPNYITENNNGDVVVSDSKDDLSGAVTVTERGGRHRFSYTGRPSGSRLDPHGICTDALSHILVCDGKTKTVQMLDKDGQFLSHLLTKSQEMGEPQGLSYDVNTHRLWVGSRLDPHGICTDALSHILVCDGKTKTVQMLDKDGQFLSHLLTKSQEMGEPQGLSYDVNTHRLWVGSRDNNKVCVYRYIIRQDALTDEHRPRPDGEAMFSSSAVEWR
ncbi:uncharacterized protein [Magallana gigas]|uniref:uncharacterized protein isoform X2 n=1 Tax=Magallana gigas TaxID=29159 RepID=UPI0033415C5E